MCHLCPPVQDPANTIQTCRMVLKNFSNAIEETLRVANTVEDDYREAGVLYHSTQMSARESPDVSEERLVALKNLFDISSIDEYHAVFSKLEDIMNTVFDMRDKHLRYSGTAEELQHRVFKDLQPAILALDVEFQAFLKSFYEVLVDARVLNNISSMQYEIDENGRPCSWNRPYTVGAEYGIAPQNEGEEWEKFRAWVSSLPETQRAVEIGRAVDAVALELLYFDPEALDYTTNLNPA
ncbi:hypothetical protein BDU57DRAFT_573309 [Ampelomyces quisqualis]|uniref:Uncharacterized protein n=1 Tax=Ampelomyces quisqualis TaxID=50730 RepID=A0A6A5QN15_AMPQU|nr:hypothetical protein BDU57DRAFT_573309 [Ampelomyces quisqualis]